MQVFFRLMGLIIAAVIVVGAVAAPALAGLGQPSPWQMGLQESATPVMDTIESFHNVLLYVITAIAGFVLLLLVIVIVRFNHRAKLGYNDGERTAAALKGIEGKRLTYRPAN